MQLTGTTVFITGGAGGIGSATARCLVQNGANVCIADMDEKKGEELAATLNKESRTNRVIFLKCDVTDAVGFKGAFEKAVTKFRKVDVMVNNAGVHDETSWEKMLAINLNGTITGTNLALAHMRKDKGGNGGAIINVSSILGYRPFYGVPVYTASKHGVVGFTRSMATIPDIKQQGVRYACVCPNTTDTPLLNLQPRQIREEYFEIIQSLIQSTKPNWISAYIVAESLLALIKDDDSNNALVEITAEEGTVRKNFRENL